MQEINLSGMEQNFKNLVKLNAQLEEEMNKMRENAEADMEKINAKYAEYYQSIPQNIENEAKITTERVIKVSGNGALNKIISENNEAEPQVMFPIKNEGQSSLMDAVVTTTEEAILNSQAENNLENSLIDVDNQEEMDELHEIFPEGSEEEEVVEEYQEELPQEQPQEKKKGSFLSRILKR